MGFCKSASNGKKCKSGGGTVLLIAVVLIIFLIGCIIEWIRVRIFKSLRIYKLLNKFDIFTEKIVDKIKMFSRDMM